MNCSFFCGELLRDKLGGVERDTEVGVFSAADRRKFC